MIRTTVPLDLLHPYFHEALKTPRAPLSPCPVPAVDRFIADNRSLYAWELALLQDEHNVNLSAAGEGDEFLDGDDNPYEGLTIISDAEFIERYVD